jgi:hypothetical protein
VTGGYPNFLQKKLQLLNENVPLGRWHAILLSRWGASAFWSSGYPSVTKIAELLVMVQQLGLRYLRTSNRTWFLFMTPNETYNPQDLSADETGTPASMLLLTFYNTPK